MEGPGRFQCPPEFEAVSPSAPPGLQGGALGGPSTELWLIRAPADFCPESLEGCTVPLDGFRQLQPPGAERLYGLRGVPGGATNALLLTPACPAAPLACAPPLRGCLTITESFGPPPGIPPAPPTKRKKKKKKTAAAEEGSSAPGEGGERGPRPPQDVGVTPDEPEVPKKKKKKHKREKPG